MDKMEKRLNLSKSLMVLCVLSVFVAAYVFLVNLVVANDSLLANQIVLPIEPGNNTVVVENATVKGIFEKQSIGALCIVNVGKRYGVLPIWSSEFGDLKWGHSIFMWLTYTLGVVGVIRVNGIVLVWSDQKNRASNLLHGFVIIIGLFFVGFFLGFLPFTLLRDVGKVLILFSTSTLVLLGITFLLRVYAYHHITRWRKISKIKDKVF